MDKVVGNWVIRLDNLVPPSALGLKRKQKID